MFYPYLEHFLGNFHKSHPKITPNKIQLTVEFIVKLYKTNTLYREVILFNYLWEKIIISFMRL